jgi:hypothetical protein
MGPGPTSRISTHQVDAAVRAHCHKGILLRANAPNVYDPLRNAIPVQLCQEYTICAALARGPVALAACCESVDTEVAALVQRQAGKQAQQCIELVKALARRQQLQQKLAEVAADALITAGAGTTNAASCVALAQAVPAQPELQQKLVAAVAAAVRASSAALQPQAQSLITQMASLSGSPQLQQELAAALADALIARGAATNAQSCIALAAAIPALPELQQQLVQALHQLLSSSRPANQRHQRHQPAGPWCGASSQRRGCSSS